MVHAVMYNKITVLFMEIHVKMVPPASALVSTVSTAGVLVDTVGFYVKTVKLIFVNHDHVKMEGLAPTSVMDFHASVLNSTQGKDASSLSMTIVRQILATMEEPVHKTQLALSAVASHHSQE